MKKKKTSRLNLWRTKRAPGREKEVGNGGRTKGDQKIECSMKEVASR